MHEKISDWSVQEQTELLAGDDIAETGTSNEISEKHSRVEHGSHRSVLNQVKSMRAKRVSYCANDLSMDALLHTSTTYISRCGTI